MATLKLLSHSSAMFSFGCCHILFVLSSFSPLSLRSVVIGMANDFLLKIGHFYIIYNSRCYFLSHLSLSSWQNKECRALLCCSVMAICRFKSRFHTWPLLTLEEGGSSLMPRGMGLRSLHLVSNGTTMRIASLPPSDGESPICLVDLFLYHCCSKRRDSLLSSGVGSPGFSHDSTDTAGRKVVLVSSYVE